MTQSVMVPREPTPEILEPRFLGHLIERKDHQSIFIPAGEPIPLVNSATVTPVYDGPQNVTASDPILPAELLALSEALEPFAAKEAMTEHYEDGELPDWSPFIPAGAYRRAAEAVNHIRAIAEKAK